MTARKDLWSGLFLTGVGLLVVLVLIPNGVDEPRKVKYAALSPSYYPRIVAIALTLLGAVVTVRAVLGGRSRPSVEDADRRPDAARRTAIFLGILALYAASVAWLGFIVASTLALIASLRLAGERRFGLTVLMAVALPLILYFFFLKIARVPMPLGVLQPLLQGV